MLVSFSELMKLLLNFIIVLDFLVSLLNYSKRKPPYLTLTNKQTLILVSFSELM